MTKQEAIELMEKEIRRYRSLGDNRTANVMEIDLEIVKEIEVTDDSKREGL